MCYVLGGKRESSYHELRRALFTGRMTFGTIDYRAEHAHVTVARVTVNCRVLFAVNDITDMSRDRTCLLFSIPTVHIFSEIKSLKVPQHCT